MNYFFGGHQLVDEYFLFGATGVQAPTPQSETGR